MKKTTIIGVLLSFLLIGCSIPSSEINSSENSSSSSLVESSNDFISEDSSSNGSSNEENSSEDSSSKGSSNEEISSGASSEDSSSSSEEEIIKLDTPIVQINEETGVVSWDEVDGAIAYNYIINDGEVLTTSSTTIQLKDKENVSVQSTNDSSCSEFSKALTYYDTSDIVIKEEKDVKVYFHNTNLNSITIKTGNTVTKPSNPSKENYTFDDWYEDPFYQNKFDFSKPIEGKTVIYANYIPNNLIKDTYFWVKASPKISSSVISSTTSSSGWKFIPLKVNEGQSSFKEFYTTVTVSGASEADPAYFLIMDGFDDNPGRTYWKNNGEDFKIKSDGTYKIYFSLEHQYAENVHGLTVQSSNTGLSYLNRLQNSNNIKTPIVNIDNTSNTATWEKDNNAIKYEVVIDNGNVVETSSNSITLNKSSHISVRSVYENGIKSSWSIPKANINYVLEENEEDRYAYVYFLESSQGSTKVEKGSKINSITLEGDGIRTFGGWYLEPGLKNKVTFPYTVNENVVFYPKWNYPSDIYTRDYYYLVNSSNTVIDGLVWNYDNYDFYEYELKNINLKSGTYKVVSLDKKIVYETFTISKEAEYSIYFSEDKLWTNQGSSRHVYVSEIVKTITIYFTNSRDSWKTYTPYAYIWNKSTDSIKSNWPGEAMKYSHTNSYGQSIYTLDVDLSKYDSIIFSVNNGNQQTVDISLVGVGNNQGYYVSDGKNSQGKYPVGTWTYSE